MLSATRNVRRSTLLLMAQEMRERVGSAIRARRKQLDIGPTEFAQLMHTSIKTIERWERGETNGAMQNLDRIAEVLKLEPQELTNYPADEQPAQSETETVLSAEDVERLKRIEEKMDEILRRLEPAEPDDIPDALPDVEDPPQDETGEGEAATG